MTLPLYQMVIQTLTDQIRQQVYLPGEKLPSIRRLADQFEVSVATIRQALGVMEERRLVEARPRSGYLVRGLVQHQPLVSIENRPTEPAVVSIHGRAMSVFQACESSRLNLGTAYPDQSFLPTRALQSIGRKLLRYKMPELTAAHFSTGEPALRHQLAQRMVETGCDVKESDLIVTNGCQEALSLCLQATCKPGDMVAIESPAFVGLLQLIEALGLKALEIPCDPQDGISLSALQLALEQWPVKAIALVPSFSNPLGSLLPQPQRKALVELATQNQVPVIEDDLFGDLSHDGSRVSPLKAYDQEGWVLYCSSVSKSIAPGFRVGWIAAGQYHQEIAFRKSFTNVSATPLSQLMVAEFIHSGRYSRHLRRLSSAFARRVHQVQHWVNRYFPEGTRCSTPSGGYVLWVQLPEGVESWDLFQDALASGIGFLPGQLFSAADKYRGFLRLNCAVASEGEVEDAVRALGQQAAARLAL